MNPSRFVLLDRIPLTPNGKADRAALPAPGRERPALERPMVAPRTPVERWVAGYWRELLDLDEVGVQDPFFELGGTSIMALRLLGRLSRDTGTNLPALLLFRAPTVADMAAILEAEHRGVLPVAAQAAHDRLAAGSNATADRAAQKREELRDRRLRRRMAP
jgi:acyl carrier protein